MDASTQHGHVSRALEALRWARPGMQRALVDLQRSARLMGRPLNLGPARAEAEEVALAEIRRALSRSRKHLADVDRELAATGWAVNTDLRFFLGRPSEDAGIADVDDEIVHLTGVVEDLDALIERLQAWKLQIETHCELPASGTPAPGPTLVPASGGSRRALHERVRRRGLLVGGVLLLLGVAVVALFGLWSVPRPPVIEPETIEPTLERFEAAWAGNRFADLEFFVKRRNRGRLWRQFERIFGRRGWDLRLPPLGERSLEEGPGNALVRYRLPKGDLVFTWVRQADGTWGIAAVTFPPR